MYDFQKKNNTLKDEKVLAKKRKRGEIKVNEGIKC